LARDNIDGKITTTDILAYLNEYYKLGDEISMDAYAPEADRVSTRIANLLDDTDFNFAPTMLFTIHDFLFRDVYPEIAGKIRKYDITKDEEVLDGDTVCYGFYADIMNTMKYDFDTERAFDYTNLSPAERVEHIAKFISGIWQIHPFAEGNTRTIAVFAIKYLHALGFDDIAVEPFERHSKYFRNALVRANYQNASRNIPYNTECLNRFFGNLLLSEQNIFSNIDVSL
jgi:fido (protein-threonine AMPylation protein)